MGSLDLSFFNILLIGLCGIITLIYLWLRRNFSYWERKGVPHIKADSYIFGNVKSPFLKKSILYHMYDDIYKKFPNQPYCGFYEFHYPVLLLRDPDVIQTVAATLGSHFLINKVTADEKVDGTFVYNPYLQDGERWKKTRAIIASAITPNKLKVLECLMKTYVEDMFKCIDNSSPGDVEVFDVCIKQASEIVANFGWGITSDGFSPDSTISKQFGLIGHFSGFAFIMMLLNPFLSRLLRIRFFPKELTSFLQSITRQTIDANKNATTKPNTFLQNVKKALEKGIDDGTDVKIRELAGFMGTFFLDSYDTTTRAVCYTLYALMMNPDTQQKLKEEILLLDEITMDTVGKLRYLDMVFNESLRLFSVVPFNVRVCNKASKVGDLEIEVGTTIVLPYNAIHKDENYYPNPDEFNPENFSEENVKNRSKCTHFPFGVGARTCIGRSYGIVYVKLLLCHILKRYDILPPKNNPIKPITAHKETVLVLVNNDPLYVTFKKTI